MLAKLCSRHFIRHTTRLGQRGIAAKVVTADQTSRLLLVQWLDGHNSKYPFVWLRDNTPDVFNPFNGQREVICTDWPLDIGIETCKSLSDTINIRWKDGHLSKFDNDWLREHCFTDQARKNLREKYRVPDQVWDKDYILKHMVCISFEDVLQNEQALYRWLYNLESAGIAKLYDTPLKEGQLDVLAAKIGYKLDTHFGDTFTVMAKNDPSHVAYTSIFLTLHSDNPVLIYTPDYQLLHFIKQSKVGGENHFVDGFKVAQELQANYPEEFKILTTTNIIYHDKGFDHYKHNCITGKYAITLDSQGKLDAIFLSNHYRGRFLDLPLEKVEPFYRALRKFHELSYKPEFFIEMKMKEGDIIAFRNNRVLHGRTAYPSDIQQGRHLQGCYFSRDVIHSRLRVLQDELPETPKMDQNVARESR